MNILTEQYQIAPLNESDKAVEVIRQAENALAEMTGSEVTLIAFEKTNEKG